MDNGFGRDNFKDDSGNCYHRWSRSRRILLDARSWIDVEKCRRSCQARRQVLYTTLLRKGVITTEMTVTPIDPDISHNGATMPWKVKP